MRMIRYLLLTSAIVAAPVAAQTLTIKPLVDARIRYEHVEQDALPNKDADAVTIRVRAGVQATYGPLSVLGEAQGTLAVVPSYYDGLHGGATRPIVSDPQNVALYRAQVSYHAKPLTLTVGRQRIALDDERFVGAVNFRDNGQTFDAVRAEGMPFKGLKVDVSYARSVRSIWGVDGVGARPSHIDGDYVFGNVGYATPIGTISGFGYIVDEDQFAVMGYRLSSQSYGGRFAGAHAFTKQVKLAYQASYARQSNYDHNPNRYAATYYMGDVGLDLGGPKIGGGYEVLGASSGVALTSFQTPLATLFKFQGWADKFLVTPPDGVRDLYASVGYGVKSIGRLKAVAFSAIYHRFDSDRVVRHYGNEIDLLASAKVTKRTTASLRFADYMADLFATNTRKIWLQLDWTI